MRQWISTAEQLPDDGIDVLCRWNFTEEMHVLRYWHEDKIWNRAMDHDHWNAPDDWMALPDGP
ncbi:MAG: DUF551 domain-containing protein [Proteobacteria bacterium]|nr:DUF551 domain-containing protein [Pseudomonadota bacterium]